MDDLLTVPFTALDRQGNPKISIDFGGSLIKVAYLSCNADTQQCDIRTRTFQTTDQDQCFTFVTSLGEWKAGDIVATGMGQAVLEFQKKLSFILLDEFTCCVKAFRRLVTLFPKKELVHSICPESVTAAEKFVKDCQQLLYVWVGTKSEVEFPMAAKEAPEEFYKWTKVPVPDGISYISADPELFPCLFVTLGSAGALMKLDVDGSSCLVGHTPRAGKTILSMASLLLGISSFQEIIELAEAGDSLNVDGEMGFYKFLKEDKTVDKYITTSLGQAMGQDKESFRREDLMRAILGHVISDITQVVAFKAEALDVKRVFFSGSLISDPFIRREFIRYIAVQRVLIPKSRVEYNFLNRGGHYGAIGALFGAPNTKGH